MNLWHTHESSRLVGLSLLCNPSHKQNYTAKTAILEEKKPNISKSSEIVLHYT